MNTAIETNLWCDAIKLPHGAVASDSPSVLWHVSCHMQMILPLRVSWTLMACNRGCSILFLARYWSNRQIACPSHTHKIVFSRLSSSEEKKRFYDMHATLDTRMPRIVRHVCDLQVILTFKKSSLKKYTHSFEGEEFYNIFSIFLLQQ